MHSGKMLPTSMQSTVSRENRFLFSELSGLVLADRRWGMAIPFLRYAEYLLAQVQIVL